MSRSWNGGFSGSLKSSLGSASISSALLPPFFASLASFFALAAAAFLAFAPTRSLPPRPPPALPWPLPGAEVSHRKLPKARMACEGQKGRGVSVSKHRWKGSVGC
jgi:hypothetical protein